MFYLNIWFILFNSMFKMFRINFLDYHFEDSSISVENSESNNIITSEVKPVKSII
jgi:hypothetical protein